MSVQLRPYQTDVINRARRHLIEGALRVIIQGATGSGKTHIACEIIRCAVAKGKRVLFLVHRRRIVKQISERLKLFGIHHGIIMAGEKPSFATVQVASRDTLLSRSVRNDWIGFPPADLVLIDECVSGNTTIQTEHGAIPISQLPAYQSRWVLSYDGVRPCWRRISAFLPKGKRDTIEITFSSGRTLRCTKDHPLLTESGWQLAGAISIGQTVLSLATSTSHATDAQNRPSKLDAFSTGLSPTPLPASADAERECLCATRRLSNSARPFVADTPNTPRDTGEDHRHGTSVSLFQSGRPSSEPSWEIPVSFTHTATVQHRESAVTIRRSSETGSSIKPQCSHACGLASESRKMAATEITPLASQPPVYRHSSKFIRSPIAAERKTSTPNGSMESVMSDSPGGLQTMAPFQAEASASTLKDTGTRKTTSSPIGLHAAMDRPESQRTADTDTSTSLPKPAAPSPSLYSLICPIACGTSYERVVSVRKGVLEEVFDITVEGTHCFFANGVLAHNCHNFRHTGAKDEDELSGYEAILKVYPHAVIIGLTATPARSDGRGLGTFFQALECTVPTSQLVREGWLVPVRCYAPERMGHARRSGKKIKGLVGDPVSWWKRLAEGRPTIVFTSKVSESQAVVAAFDDAGIPAAHIDAHTPDDERERIITQVEKGEIKVLSNVGVMVEGVDVPALSCCILLRMAGSYILYAQAVGRVMRSHPGKKDAVLLDHAGACYSHGLPDEDVEWSLDTEDTVDARNAKSRKDHPEKQPIVCPVCAFIFQGAARCPSCDHLLARKLRPVQTSDEILTEVRRSQDPALVEEERVRFWFTSLRVMAHKGRSLSAARCMWKSKYKEWPPDTLPHNDFPFEDWQRPVAELLPQFAPRGRVTA